MPTITRNLFGNVQNAQEWDMWPPLVLTRVVSGVVTAVLNEPDRRPKPEGPLFEHPTPLPLQSREHYHYLKYLFRVYPRPGYHGWYVVQTSEGPGYLSWLPMPDFPTNLWVNKLRNQISELQGVNIAEDVFEYRQTSDLASKLTGAVARGYRFYRAAKRGDVLVMRQNARRPLTKESIAEAHLAASWGVVPLVNSLQESLDKTNVEFAKDGPYWKRFRVKSGWDDSKHTNVGGIERDYTMRLTERVVCWVLFRPGGVRQVHFGNILELGWNLTTLSCIADWFIPVGEALAALDALSGVERTFGTVTSKTEIRKRAWVTSRISVDGIYYVSQECPQKQELRKQTHERTVFTTVPFATLPRWDPSPSWRKLSLAVAVLVGLRGGARTKAGSDPLKPIPDAQCRRLARAAAAAESRALAGKSSRVERDIWSSPYDR